MSGYKLPVTTISMTPVVIMSVALEARHIRTAKEHCDAHHDGTCFEVEYGTIDSLINTLREAHCQAFDLVTRPTDESADNVSAEVAVMLDEDQLKLAMSIMSHSAFSHFVEATKTRSVYTKI